MEIPGGNRTPVIRLFVLRELERQHGQREFSFTDVRNTHGIYGCDKHNVADEMRLAGLLERVSRGRYVLSNTAIELLKECREVFV